MIKVALVMGFSGLFQSRESILGICRRMSEKGFVANHDGNVSVRLAADRFLITPTSFAKSEIESMDLLEVDRNGKKISGRRLPFSEFAVHRAVYDLRKDVGAVVHAHPPYAMAVGLHGQEILTSAVPEAVVSLGARIPLVGLHLPQSESFFSEFRTLVPEFDAVMVSGNGVFSWGDDLEQAYLRLELVEHLARILIIGLPLASQGRTIQILDDHQMRELLKKRTQAGLGPDARR